MISPLLVYFIKQTEKDLYTLIEQSENNGIMSCIRINIL